MAYTTIFFDLDGTLIDPKIGITKAVQHALSKFNIHEDLESLIPFIGPPLDKSFQKYYGFSEEESMQAIIFYREYFIPTGMYESFVYNGIFDLLKKLKETNNTLFVVTSKPTWVAEKVIKHHKFDDYFEKIIGANLGFLMPINHHSLKKHLRFILNNRKIHLS
jgi:phosphoglycolate phosphatase